LVAFCYQACLEIEVILLQHPSAQILDLWVSAGKLSRYCDFVIAAAFQYLIFTLVDVVATIKLAVAS
jgi:hypothetical protein